MHTTPDSAPQNRPENIFIAGLEYARQNRGLTTGLGILALTGALTAGYGMQYETIDTATSRVEGGGTRTAVANLSAELADKHDIPFADVAGIDTQGIILGGEIIHETGEMAGPDDIISVTLEKNGFGQIRVDADYLASTPSPNA